MHKRPATFEKEFGQRYELITEQVSIAVEYSGCLCTGCKELSVPGDLTLKTDTNLAVKSGSPDPSCFWIPWRGWGLKKHKFCI